MCCGLDMLSLKGSCDGAQWEGTTEDPWTLVVCLSLLSLPACSLVTAQSYHCGPICCSLPPPCETWRENPGHQAWQQGQPLPVIHLASPVFFSLERYSALDILL